MLVSVFKHGLLSRNCTDCLDRSGRLESRKLTVHSVFNLFYIKEKFRIQKWTLIIILDIRAKPIRFASGLFFSEEEGYLIIACF